MAKDAFYAWMESIGMLGIENVNAHQEAYGMEMFVIYNKNVQVVWCGTKILSLANVIVKLFGMVIIVLLILVKVDKYGTIS